MYRILIGDEEETVIDTLTDIISKNFGDACLIESAKTGRHVIELAEMFHPDIAFIEIRMPGINGIEAIKEIRKSSPNTVFIVTSAYDKFEYVKEALHIGALDYLKKNADLTVIAKLVQNAVRKVDIEREKRSRELLLQEKLKIITPVIENAFIYSLLFGGDYEDELENFKRLLGIQKSEAYMMVIECAFPSEDLAGAAGGDVCMRHYYKELREILKEHFVCVVSSVITNMVVVLVPCEDGVSGEEEEYKERLHRMENARSLTRKLKTHLDAPFRVGIGSVQKLGRAGVSYTEAMNAIRLSAGQAGDVRDIPAECDNEEEYPAEMERSLLRKIEEGDINGVISEAGLFFDRMTEKYAESFTNIKLKTLELVLITEHIGCSRGTMAYRFKSRQDYLQMIIGIKNYEELRIWFLTKMQEACRCVAVKNEKNATGIVGRAKEYIKTHYQKDISLEDVSREVNISPYYFSKLFKEATGENFIEYVTAVRIEKAKELLRNTDKSMKEICVEIGYADPNYFSRLFKKNMGVTPTEYKKGR